MHRVSLLRQSSRRPSKMPISTLARQQHQRQLAKRLAVPTVLVTAGILHQNEQQQRYTWSRTSSPTTKTKLDAAKNPIEKAKDAVKKHEEKFDLTEKFSDFGKASEEWKERLLGSQDKEEEPKEAPLEKKGEPSGGLLGSITSFLGIDEGEPDTKSKPKNKETVQGMGETLMTLMSGKQTSIDDVVQQVNDMNGRGEVQDSVDVVEIFNIAKKCAKMLDKQLDEFFGDEQPPPLYLTSLMYYIEKQDQVKTPSWKRREHRFFPGIDMNEMDDSYEKMLLADLGYEDDIEVIRETLKQDYNSELVYCSNVSRPNKPAHFVAVKRDQSRWSNELEVLVVVCGTKSITDVITDLLCEAAPYRDGLAHSGITEGGIWLVEKHSDLLDKLRELTNKKRIKMTLIGHSLGAAAATIAGMEWNDDPTIDVEVIGFGCPALLSKDLSEKVEPFVTAIIADSDCVPRMSMATMVNALMDVTELDITPYAQQDFKQTANQLQRFLPFLVDDNVKKKILSNLNGLLPEPPKVNEENKKRMEVELFPPGKIIHFYRDGYGITGSITPATFFDEIEVSRRLLDDHLFTEGYQRIYLDLMRQYHGDNFFTFEKQAEEGDSRPSKQEDSSSSKPSKKSGSTSKRWLSSWSPLFVALCLVYVTLPICLGQRIAIIGGGITGSFSAKYVTDLEKDAGDGECSVHSLTLFSPVKQAPGETVDTSENDLTSMDARYSSYQITESNPVELGKAILSEELYPLVTEMVKQGNLGTEKPLEHVSTLTEKDSTMFLKGHKEVILNVNAASSSLWREMMWRYSMDLYIVNRLASKLQAKLVDAKEKMKNLQDGQSFWNSPDEIWNALLILGLVHTKFDDLLDKYMVSSELSWWRKFLPIQQGAFRQEALSSMLLSMFNQNESHLNAISGLFAYLLAMDGTAYRIRGGNEKLISVAWQAAKETHAKKCPKSSSEAIQHLPLRVSTVVGSVYGFELYDSKGQTIGEFDQIILAEPMPSLAKTHSIEFLIKSHMDETAVLQQMPLGGLIENAGEEGTPEAIPDDHDGHSPLPHRLPAAITRPFVQSVTTIVKGAKLQHDYWFGDDGDSKDGTPSKVFMTAEGKSNEHNVTGIFKIKSDDDGKWYKICSSQALPRDVLQQYFGPDVQVVKEHQYNIAPDHQGEGTSTNFLLYDAANGFHGHSKAGALYYASAMEHSLSTPETQAMSALAVAKLIAKRLEWIDVGHEFSAGEEL